MKRIAFVLTLFCAVVISVAATGKELLFMPFQFGTYWWCPQANGGSYTHTGNLYWAFDFNQIKSINGPSDPAYNKPVHSPLEGTVHTVVNNVPDFQNNSGSNKENNYGWGNVVLIEDTNTNNCVRICHFKQNSIVVQKGQKIEAGQYLGKLGMTGWSTNPHLHIHMQANCTSSQSVPFAFIEGPVTDNGDWNTLKMSELMPRSSVLDEDNSTNLGNYFSQSGVTKEGSWQPGNLTSGFTGDSYLVHQVTQGDTDKLSWMFKVYKAGYYVVFAKWTAHPNRDPKTKYTVFGWTVYANQQQNSFTGWHYLGWGYLETVGAYQITVQGTTKGQYVVADSIIAIKL